MSKNPHGKSGEVVEMICFGLGFLALGIVFCPLFRPIFHIIPYYNVGTDIIDWIFGTIFSTLGILMLIGGISMVRERGGVSMIRDIMKIPESPSGLTRVTIMKMAAGSFLALLLGIYLGYALIFHPDPTSSLGVHILIWTMECSLMIGGSLGLVKSVSLDRKFWKKLSPIELGITLLAIDIFFYSDSGPTLMKKAVKIIFICLVGVIIARIFSNTVGVLFVLYALFGVIFFLIGLFKFLFKFLKDR